MGHPAKLTYVYVDAFNLYYRAVRGTRNRWLDIRKLCKAKLNHDNKIVKIKYFTALVKRSALDPSRHTRQQVYLRALKTIPNLEIIEGRYTQHTAWRIVAGSPPEDPKWVEVILPEEKGSDVNLATHLVNDGHLGLYDLAVVITNDSDLRNAMRIVKEDLGKLVGLLCPADEASAWLSDVTNFSKFITEEDTRKSQFRRTLRDGQGTFRRPQAWD